MKKKVDSMGLTVDNINMIRRDQRKGGREHDNTDYTVTIE
jgi:hypothetical protein